MRTGRRAWLLVSCAAAGVALWCSGAGAAPPSVAAPLRMVPVAASDVRPPASARPVVVAASAGGLSEPPGMASPQCEGLLGEARQACIERTAFSRR